MRKAILILLIFTFQISLAKSFVITKQDTMLNYVDQNGLKQGHWIIYNKMIKLPKYKPDQKVYEGKYQDSRKTGIWDKYFPNGNVENKITYVNNRPDGYAIMYHENGKISEEGLWKNNRWVGDYKLYYDNGQIQHEFKYNKFGKRDGTQKYYYPNGQVMIEGHWDSGKQNGEIKQYYSNGDLKSDENFVNGHLDSANSKYFKPKAPVKPEPVVDKEPDSVKVKVVAKKDEKPNLPNRIFNGEGYWKLYNQNRQVSKEGTFHHGALETGKVYHYSKNGILIRVAVYKHGVYIGDAPLSDETDNN